MKKKFDESKHRRDSLGRFAEMSAEEDPVVSHEIIDHIEKETLDRMNVHLVIHFDPVVKNE